MRPGHDALMLSVLSSFSFCGIHEIVHPLANRDRVTGFQFAPALERPLDR
jgi:hypothetical protein